MHYFCIWVPTVNVLLIVELLLCGTQRELRFIRDGPRASLLKVNKGSKGKIMKTSQITTTRTIEKERTRAQFQIFRSTLTANLPQGLLKFQQVQNPHRQPLSSKLQVSNLKEQAYLARLS